jgi:hypothetical protein
VIALRHERQVRPAALHEALRVPAEEAPLTEKAYRLAVEPQPEGPAKKVEMLPMRRRERQEPPSQGALGHCEEDV